MSAIIYWTITTDGVPEIIRGCTKCGGKQPFASGGQFRVNAQQRNLDVWLVHRCKRCGSTWNMDIHSRVSPGALDRGDYDGYLSNDPALAKRRAFDRSLLRMNRAEARYDHLEIAVEGPEVDPGALTGTVDIVLRCDHDLDVKLERLLRQKLGLTRSALEKLADRGQLRCDGHNPLKARFQNGIRLTLSPACERTSVFRQIVVI